jgi:DNA mismatch endonuclease (patch repair protein)
MSDVFSKAKRSEVMARIRGRGNATTEIAFMKMLRAEGITGWRRHLRLSLGRHKEGRTRSSARPDFVIRASKLAVFVDGCFWHGCPLHAIKPVGNRSFWNQKLTGNRLRDRHVTEGLRRRGWTVMRVWEHELQGDNGVVAVRLKRQLRRAADKNIRIGRSPELGVISG